LIEVGGSDIPELVPPLEIEPEPPSMVLRLIRSPFAEKIQVTAATFPWLHPFIGALIEEGVGDTDGEAGFLLNALSPIQPPLVEPGKIAVLE
jgi:hypothetical protein